MDRRTNWLPPHSCTWESLYVHFMNMIMQVVSHILVNRHINKGVEELKTLILFLVMSIVCGWTKDGQRSHS